MMSYLWILLLGSLLAASAKAQDNVEPTEEAAGPDAPALDAVPDVNKDPATDEEISHTVEELPVTEPADPADGDAGPVTAADEDAGPVTTAPGDAGPVTTAPGDAGPVTTAEEDAGPVTTTDEDVGPMATADEDAGPVTTAPGDAGPVTTANEDAGSVAPADGDTGSVAPADGDTGSVAPADGDTGPVAPADGDTETETAATTQGPADPGVEDAEANGEEQPTSNTAQKIGPDVEVSPAADADDREEKPTVSAFDLDLLERVGTVLDPTVKVEIAGKVNAGFNSEDVNKAHPGKSRSIGSGAHAAGATVNDKPEGQEANSSLLPAVLSAITVAVVVAIIGYFTYQKKKLCFKNRQGQEADPEAARKADAAEAQSDPQVLSNLLNS